MSKKIKLAKFAGFCYGVKRAVDSVLKLKNENPDCKICILGELIHNSHVVSQLKNKGIETIYELPQIGCGYCVIRSHGESPQIFEEIEKIGFNPIDLTCPDVKKVQQKAIELVKNGYYLIIVGKSTHPEVIAIEANARIFSDNILVAQSIEEIQPYEQELKSKKKIGIVVQTTQMIATLNKIVEYLLPITKELLVANTICKSTTKRQSEAIELAKQSDLMIVVGSKNSANTTHLAQIIEKICPVIHIETSEELNEYKELIEKSERISVTAGASTPDDIIKKVIETLENT